MNGFRLPGPSHRVSLIGSTGSGKTQLGAWLLAKAAFDRMPYTIVDYKGDDLLNASDRIIELDLKETPKKPGLYIIHPRPKVDDDLVEDFMQRIWAQENSGFLFDEGYMVPQKGGAFNAILTQGRSKKIPAIVLTQRPSWVSRFVFSEAEFFGVLRLNDLDDQLTVRRFLPRDKIDITKTRLPEYHSHWYDVGKDAAFQLAPVPDADTIAEMIHSRLQPRKRTF